jgi:hypothetical protein
MIGHWKPSFCRPYSVKSHNWFQIEAHIAKFEYLPNLSSCIICDKNSMSKAQVARILWGKKIVLPKKSTQFYHILTYRELVLPENQSHKFLGSLHFH